MTIELTTLETWYISQMIVSGDITLSEFMEMNSSLRETQRKTISSLTRKGVLDYTTIQI